MREVVSSLDLIATSLEKGGYIDIAYQIDRYSNTLEKLAIDTNYDDRNSDLMYQMKELYTVINMLYKDMEIKLKSISGLSEEKYRSVNLEFKKKFLNQFRSLFLKIRKVYTEGGRQGRALWSDVQKLQKQ
jgi:hypothetical protein